MSAEEVCRLPLTEAARLLAAKEVSAVELTEACLRRIEQAEPTLNAFISLDLEGAFDQARAADAALARGQRAGPLHGVPLAHKDLYYRAGVVTTCGSAIRKDFRPEVDATALTRLAAAGALHLGGLNMAEFALGPTGHNQHYGHCHNPWHPAHVTGGSSSGSGATVAARLVFGALGSDTGGSIRLPAAYCGVVGIKPTNGLVSRFGVMPLSQTLDCVGPLARTVRDAARLLQVIGGADPADPTSLSRPVPDYEEGLDRPVCGRRIGVLTGGPAFPYMRGPARAAYEQAARPWSDLGCDVVEIASPDLDAVTAAAAVVMQAETAAFHWRWLHERPLDYSPEVRIRLETGLGLPAAAYLDALSVRGRMVAAFCAEVFGQCDALMAPVISSPAPTIEATDAHTAEDLRELIMPISHCTRPLNYLGLPGLALPSGLVDGLPFGFQLIGQPFAEALLFNLGHAYEDASGWGAQSPPLT